ncbi:MAG: hypothetical protein JSS91_09095 [Bacteroidetes bacterium]|nr:hypothetical protein [Bacteroidota bacterium]
MISKPKEYPFYPIWNGSLNLGDTPGVFFNSTYIGLIFQFPINISFIPSKPKLKILLVTSEVEVYDKNTHQVYFDWIPGNSLPIPIGEINDKEIIPHRPEFHLLEIETTGLSIGNHTITIIVNPNISIGLKDDFILYNIDVDNDAGVRIGSR